MTIEEFLEKVKIYMPSATLGQVEKALDGIEPSASMARGVANQISANSALAVSTPKPVAAARPALSGRRSVQAIQAAQALLRKKGAAAANPVDDLVAELEGQVEGYVSLQAQRISRIVDPVNIAARIMIRAAEAPTEEPPSLDLELWGSAPEEAGGESEIEIFLNNFCDLVDKDLEGENS